MGDKTVKTKSDQTPSPKDKASRKALKEAEEECMRLLEKKKQLDKALVGAVVADICGIQWADRAMLADMLHSYFVQINLEASIYDFETSYFENTAGEGNIVRGFDGYLTTNKPDKKRHQVKDWERIFSHSSVTFKQ
ncbi:chromatin modification- protein eaf6, partial [Spiromyces aspiralis]